MTGCEEAKSALEISTRCCRFCHEGLLLHEDDQHFTRIVLPDGRKVAVCCSVAVESLADVQDVIREAEELSMHRDDGEEG